MAWHPTLDDLERRPDTPWQPRRPYPRAGAPPAEGTGPDDWALGSWNCWCGQPRPHDWPGKTAGAPHPRKARP